MKVTEKTFTVDLTEDDVKLIVSALHSEYKNYGKSPAIRDLRNAFAGLINIHYIGEDA